ncbi:MAG TPA: hypothetical protein DCX06_05980 [Opitutae bacterium]|nr:hypothetical protein [Opitutae bacterium]
MKALTDSTFQFPTKRYILPFCTLLISVLLSGCASSKAGKNATVIGGSALGAIIAHEASDGDAAWTTGGAALGALTAIGANALAEENERQAYRSGYEAALNQSVKQQYWITQNRQKEDAFAYETQTESFVPIQIPEQQINGEIRNSRIIYLKAK